MTIVFFVTVSVIVIRTATMIIMIIININKLALSTGSDMPFGTANLEVNLESSLMEIKRKERGNNQDN